MLDRLAASRLSRKEKYSHWQLPGQRVKVSLSALHHDVLDYSSEKDLIYLIGNESVLNRVGRHQVLRNVQYIPPDIYSEAEKNNLSIYWLDGDEWIEIPTYVYFGSEDSFFDIENGPRMHHKFAVIDDRVWYGTFNWTGRANLQNFEDIRVTGDSNAVEEFVKCFEYTKNKCIENYKLFFDYYPYNY